VTGEESLDHGADLAVDVLDGPMPPAMVRLVVFVVEGEQRGQLARCVRVVRGDVGAA